MSSDGEYVPGPEEDDENGEEGKNPCRESQKPGPYLYFGIALLACAVVLVIILNTPMIQPSAATTLTNGPWNLQSIAMPGGSLDTVPATPSVTIRFDRNGRLSGNAGCNEYSATYTTNSFAIAITMPVTSLKSCQGEGVMANETLYLTNLANATEYRVSSQLLKLYDSSGRPLLSFVPARS